MDLTLTKNKQIDSDHLTTELYISGCKLEVVAVSPYIEALHLPCREGPTWLALAEKYKPTIDSNHLGIDGCVRCWEIQEEGFQTSPMYLPSVSKHL